jgi:hypothetical protein
MQFNGNLPASDELIALSSARLKRRLPPDYVRFLQQMNGGEGFLSDNYVALWRVEDLFDQNANYKVELFAPGLLIFGSDGAGEAFAFDMRFDPPPVVAVPFVPMDFDAAIRIASSFDDFMDKAAQCPDLLTANQ